MATTRKVISLADLASKYRNRPPRKVRPDSAAFEAIRDEIYSRLEKRTTQLHSAYKLSPPNDPLLHIAVWQSLAEDAIREAGKSDGRELPFDFFATDATNAFEIFSKLQSAGTAAIKRKGDARHAEVAAAVADLIKNPRYGSTPAKVIADRVFTQMPSLQNFKIYGHWAESTMLGNVKKILSKLRPRTRKVRRSSVTKSLR